MIKSTRLATYFSKFTSLVGATSKRGWLTGSLIIGLWLAGTAVAVRGQSALDGFDPNANGAVRAIVVQPDGKILIGGDFTTLSPNGGGTVTRNHIARLNPDGTLDAAFDPNANNTVVYSIAVQADGKILAGGDFTNIGGQARNRIARLDATTGAADLTFNPNANNTVRAIAVQADTKIILGGDFNGANSIGAATRNYLARIDATTGAADTFDPNANATIYTIVVQTDTKILIGGDLNTLAPNGGGAVAQNGIARLNPTGTLDTFPSANSTVYTIAVQPDGKILAGGEFNGMNSIGGISGLVRNRIARLKTDGTLDTGFNPNANAFVAAIVVQADGQILAVGGFVGASSIGGQNRNRIARLDPTTGNADTLNPNSNNSLRSVAVQADGKILVGGDFNGAGSLATQTRNYIARLETDGRLDQTLLDLGIAGSQVFATAVQPDGKILIGGVFSSVLATPRNNIARLNAVTGAADSFDPNANQTVYSIAVQADGKILVGGDFNGPNSIGGQTRNRIARLDSVTGAADTTWDPNANSTVNSIAVQADGKILAGGDFFSGIGTPTIGGQTRNRIARLDAATGAADTWDPNANSTVVSIVVQQDGKILVGGGFNSGISTPTIGGATRNSIARLDAATGAADTWNPNANSTVNSIAVQADGKILAGGFFNGGNSIGVQTRNYIARLDAVTGLPDSFDPVASAIVNSIVVQADGKILAGGQFSSIGGQTRSLFARLTNDTAALQNLAVTQTTITWTRGGSSAQFTRVTFEYSNDNVTYSSLGSGTASGSNWTRTGLSLSTGQNIYIRARGYYRSGYQNGSESITESVRNVFIAGPTAADSTISGRITTSDGTPIAGVVIQLGGAQSRDTITNSSGNYHFDNLDTGNFYTVTPSLANYHFSPASRSFSLVGNQTDATFTANPDSVASVNAIDTNEYFVRQQYLDFLGREPDQGGFEYWTGQINQCNGDASCIRQKRIDVSAAFFASPEFQQTGSYIYGLYAGTLGRTPGYSEFMSDRVQVVGGANLDASKEAFAAAFIQRPEFTAQYPVTMTREQFVDALLQTLSARSGIDQSAIRDPMLSDYDSGGRSLVVRDAVQANAFAQAEYNKAFVLMEYFGYLRRGPDSGGYDFWLELLNGREAENYRGMVCAFITSAEYQRRFSTVVSHNNSECGP